MAQVAAMAPAAPRMGIRWGRILSWFVALGASGSLVFHSLHRWEAVRDREQGLLSVPPISFVKTVSSGYRNMISDVYYMQFTTYWGYWLTHGRKFHNLYPLVDLVTELDPEFKSAYEVGSLALADEGEINKAADILAKGMHYHPKDYWYPYQTGMMYFLYGDDYLLAAKYFEAASKIPGCPPDAEFFAARMYAVGGQQELARTRWLQIYMVAVKMGDRSRKEVATRSLKRFKIEGRDLDLLEIYVSAPDLEAKQFAAYALSRRGIDALAIDPGR